MYFFEVLVRHDAQSSVHRMTGRATLLPGATPYLKGWGSSHHHFITSSLHHLSLSAALVSPPHRRGRILAGRSQRHPLYVHVPSQLTAVFITLLCRYCRYTRSNSFRWRHSHLTPPPQQTRLLREFERLAVRRCQVILCSSRLQRLHPHALGAWLIATSHY
jgi:hypothetical protein